MKKNLKVLDVVAEKEEQVFIYNFFDLNPCGDIISIPEKTKVEDVYDAVISVNFDNVIILNDKAIVQGVIHKNIIFKLDNGELYHDSVDIVFAEESKLPGLKPTTTVGKFNRAVMTNNIIEIGPDNQGTTAGFDVQIYLTQLTSEEILLDCNKKLDQKIVLDYILKISKFEQVNMEFPEPNTIYEFKNLKSCNKTRIYR
ncbi:MAG: hypothetical protein ACOCZ5_02685 [bacterium]